MSIKKRSRDWDLAHICSDDRIQHLLDLLDQPDAEASISSPAIDERETEQPNGSPSAGSPKEENAPAASVLSDTDITQTNGRSEQPQQAVGGMALNFLQEDELAEPEIEESYEVVPMLEPHQVSVSLIFSTAESD